MPITAKSYTDSRSKAYVAHKVNQAKRPGAKRIDPAAAAFAKRK